MGAITNRGRAKPFFWRAVAWTGLAVGTFGAVATIGAARAAGNVVVYCGVNEEWCRAAANAFEQQSGVHVDMTRQSAGEIYARLRAEKDNPRGDIWFGGTGDPHLQGGVRQPDRPLYVAGALAAPALGTEPGEAVGQPHGRALPRGARLRLQRRRPRQAQARRPGLLGRPPEARVSGRSRDGRPEFLRHRLDDACDDRAADGRRQGVRLHEGPEQEHRPNTRRPARPRPWPSARARRSSVSPSSTT